MTTLELEENSASPRLCVPSTKAAQIVQIARSWIGTPYVHQASVKGAGCDCLGLLRGVWRELRGEEPETSPPYAPDWSEATGEETLYKALARHLTEIDKRTIAPGDVALFRMISNGPAKHCGIVASKSPPPCGEVEKAKLFRVGGNASSVPPPEMPSLRSSISISPQGGGNVLTLIHARQNKRVSEERFSSAWQRKLAAAFRI
jgi:NlpC/P60 family putative phage cell wall peptidase